MALAVECKMQMEVFFAGDRTEREGSGDVFVSDQGFYWKDEKIFSRLFEQLSLLFF